MATRLSKSGLGIIISKLEDFKEHVLALEQYSTPSEIAAEMLWDANLIDGFHDKVVLDPACGPGFLGIGALLLGAKKVFFLDINDAALGIARRNYQRIVDEYDNIGDAEFVLDNVSSLANTRKNLVVSVEIVLQNPPFGTKIKHHDKIFLESVFSLPNIKAIYTVHKVTSKTFIEAIAADHKFKVTHFKQRTFKLRPSQEFHRKRLFSVEVGIWRLESEFGR